MDIELDKSSISRKTWTERVNLIGLTDGAYFNVRVKVLEIEFALEEDVVVFEFVFSECAFPLATLFAQLDLLFLEFEFIVLVLNEISIAYFLQKEQSTE